VREGWLLLGIYWLVGRQGHGLLRRGYPGSCGSWCGPWRWQAGAVSVAGGLVAIRVPDRFVRLLGLAYTGFGDWASAGGGWLAEACIRRLRVSGGIRQILSPPSGLGFFLFCFPRVALRFTRGNTILSPPSGLGGSISGLSPGSARYDSLHRKLWNGGLIARAAPSARLAPAAAWGEGETPVSGFGSCLGGGLARWIHGGLPGERPSLGFGLDFGLGLYPGLRSLRSLHHGAIFCEASSRAFVRRPRGARAPEAAVLGSGGWVGRGWQGMGSCWYVFLGSSLLVVSDWLEPFLLPIQDFFPFARKCRELACVGFRVQTTLLKGEFSQFPR
jgi:hypothetical protein